MVAPVAVFAPLDAVSHGDQLFVLLGIGGFRLDEAAVSAGVSLHTVDRAQKSGAGGEQQGVAFAGEAVKLAMDVPQRGRRS